MYVRWRQETPDRAPAWPHVAHAMRNPRCVCLARASACAVATTDRYLCRRAERLGGNGSPASPHMPQRTASLIMSTASRRICDTRDAVFPAQPRHAGRLIGLAAAAEHGTPVGLTALPELVRDARDGWPAVPELVGATAAADMLKVSRQQVWNLIEGGSLPGQRVGRDWVIPADAVRALVEKRSAGA